jgi:signal transduction histidine kinase
VAHEINNPLEAMGNLIYLAKSRPGVPPEALEDLQHAEEEMARVSHVTRQTLGFYREATTPGTYDPAVLVDSVLRLYANKLKVKKIQLESEFGECPEMRGWAGELKQVISNLVSNAIDAMGENGKLKVTVCCLQAPEHAQVEITVQDDGHGIPPEHRERVFEPFFTTKKEVGTGLGLYVSKQIIARHEGQIEIHSRTDNGGRGTIFRILLPVRTTTHTRAATTV